MVASGLNTTLSARCGMGREDMKWVTAVCLVVRDVEHILADPRLVVNEEVQR